MDLLEETIRNAPMNDDILHGRVSKPTVMIDMNKPGVKLLCKIAPTYKYRITNGLCPSCGEPATEFRDEISLREFSISGLCQTCQDEIFGMSDD